ncbi:MAG TPA: stage III sporulation protein AD [Candidatus Blautia gallistercoris]|uniref:Stage III sporulation protein AD n=1 Tax=Candidatus Blautia gallistercoris TaxID=2838490 RepID=A0A9D1WH02_9FIRM|nr:stage III sporulation protein AD [Candidatus Blautia gallistercoris]
MEMIRVSVLGITGVLLGFLLKNTKPEYSFYLSMGIGICILILAVGKLQYLFASLEKIRSYLPVDSSYLTILLKMMGISYIGQFSSGICKDAGFSAIAGQIEIFGKLVIMGLSMPVLLALLETVHGFLS